MNAVAAKALSIVRMPKNIKTTMGGCHPFHVERAIAVTVSTKAIGRAGMLQY